VASQLRVLFVALLALVMSACSQSPTAPTSTQPGPSVAGSPQIVTYSVASERIDRIPDGRASGVPIYVNPAQPLTAGLIKVRGRGIEGGAVDVFLFRVSSVQNDPGVDSCARLNDCSAALAGPVRVINDQVLEVGVVASLTRDIPSMTRLIYLVRGGGFVAGWFDVTITGEEPR
jgi:hypothetical protein